ncbi:neuraminidase-like domain-containing protein [Pseudomonas putida]|uniref:Tc toxin subunit A-related protein n=1 Tax=Pseudomonas putida TaxID=303 RepID=UPI002365C887|nr:neuraminidase-like domain-containing protein [Pseudomonas putida]MDD2047768.1 neuraminidase-like domain-containing protein [Pseudomonas putida]
MNSQLPLLAKLNEDRREAMVKYFLGQVAPAEGTASGQLKTAEDLYQYQLIDNQVSDKVKTSWVAEAIASLQQYIHGIYNGMEPGHDRVFSQEEVAFWRDWESQYAIWSANEMLQYYPENYIDPSLRLKKTELFKTLEMDINQARINDTRVREALMNYLSTFDQVSNLQVRAGYMDGCDRRQSDYYFIGSEKFTPLRYFFRKAKVSLQPSNTRMNPTAWEEWTEISLSFGRDVTHIRPVYSAKRLYLVWVERIRHERQPQGDTAATAEWRHEVKLSYLDVNGMWVAPMNVGHLTTADEKLQYTLMAVSFTSFSQVGATLVVALVPLPQKAASKQADVAGDEPVLVNAWNSAFEPVQVDAGKLAGLALVRYTDAAVVQQRFVDIEDAYSKLEYELASITQNRAPIEGWVPFEPIDGVNQHLELEVEFVTSSTSDVKFNIRGKCTALRYTKRIDRLFLSTALAPGQPIVKIEIQEGDLQSEGSRATLIFHPELMLSPASVEVWYKQTSLLKTGPHKGLFSKRFMVSHEIVEAINNASPEEVTSGINFTITINGKSIGFASERNFLHTKFDRFKATKLRIWKRFGDDYEQQGEVWNGTAVLSGDIKTAAVTYAGSLNSQTPERQAFIFGATQTDNPSTGYSWFDVRLKATSASAPSIVEAQVGGKGNGGQFLTFNDSGFQVPSVRLNSLFSQHLIQRLAVSVDQLLHWDTQHLPEPGTPETPGVPVPLDFNGANGRFLWELFFHVPHLIAQRLKLELNHAQAQNWLHYVFNPAARVIPAAREAQSYWQSRPLLEEGDMNYEIEGPTDPDAIAYSTPEHYRKTIFIDYVRNLIDWADGLYRRQTRDSLSEAKLLYVRALSLMGNPPDYRGVSRWHPAPLESLASSDTVRLAALEASIDPALMANIAQRPGGPVWWGVLDSPAFQPPVNESLLEIWATLASRLSTMRRNLTLDGKPMSLQLYEAMANPQDLLRAQAGSAGFGQRNPGGHFVVPPYRFLSILGRAQSAVETLIRFGEQVRQFMEQGDRAQQEEMVQSQLVEMAGFAVQLQEESIAQVEATKASLEANLAAVQLRFEYYRSLADERTSKNEGEAMGLMVQALPPQQASAVFSTLGGALDTLPNVFGLANGGYRAAGPAYATGTASSITGITKQSRSGNLDASERYSRRSQEWGHLRDLASKEAEALTAQIEVQDIQITAAKTALAQQVRAQGHAGELNTFLTKTRGTKVSLFRWLLGQMSTLHFQTYDAVVALCSSVQASWQYEIGDYETSFIQPNVWFDNYHGLTAGDALKLALLNMESAFIHRNERRLEIVKTVSLRQLFGEPAWAGPAGALETLKSKGSLPFSVTAKMLDEDYPGLYLRQLLRVAVTLPAVLGPYQDIKARLLQVSSKTVIKPEIAAVRYCHDANNEQANPGDIKFNLRPSGQIAISNGLDDNGVLQMNFDDGRYLPFEGTGADSEWLLEFPRFQSDTQKKLLGNITDIIVHFHYTAVDGGQTFSGEVEKLLGESDGA